MEIESPSSYLVASCLLTGDWRSILDESELLEGEKNQKCYDHLESIIFWALHVKGDNRIRLGKEYYFVVMYNRHADSVELEHVVNL